MYSIFSIQNVFSRNILFFMNPIFLQIILLGFPSANYGVNSRLGLERGDKPNVRGASCGSPLYRGVPTSFLPISEVSYLFDLRLGIKRFTPSPSLLVVYYQFHQLFSSVLPQMSDQDKYFPTRVGHLSGFPCSTLCVESSTGSPDKCPTNIRCVLQLVASLIVINSSNGLLSIPTQILLNLRS